MEFVKGTCGEGSVIVKEHYRGYDISIATTSNGQQPDMMVYKDGECVTKTFGCYQNGEIYGSMENIRAIMDEIDTRTTTGAKIKVLDPYPPNSNPWDYDTFRMGGVIGNWAVMHKGNDDHTTVITHIPTGTNFSLDCSTLRMYYSCMKSTFAEVNSLDPTPHVFICEGCIPEHQCGTKFSNWNELDSNKKRYNYKLLEDKPSARGILSCDCCGE